jgi:hypothetical protein
MENDQYASPVLIRKNETIILQRVPLMENVFNESWLQNLLFENPTILPFSDLEPTFDGSLPIVREMGTGAGPVDLIYMNSKGYITLVETKLWRNPEARRAVVAQIIDYAKEIAEWSYEQFVEAIKRSSLYKNRSGDPLIDQFSDMEGDDFDQVVFIDRVIRNLQKGRFLLLIVGDGIQEGVERMASFLQQTPHLGYSLALVELAIYRESPERKESLYIQPKILARTKEITRAIVELRIPATYSDIKVTLPPAEKPGKGSTRRRITEEEFFEELEKSSGDKSVEFAKWVLDQAEDNDLRIDWREAGPILKYNDPESGQFFTLGQLHKNGGLTQTLRLHTRFRKLGWPFDACLDYFDEVASLIPGASRKAFKAKPGRKQEWEQIVYGKKPGPASYPPFEILSEKKEDWFNAISKLIDRIQAFSGDQE